MKYNLILPREMGVELSVKLSVTQWAMGIHNGEYPLVIKRGNEQSPIYRYL